MQEVRMIFLGITLSLLVCSSTLPSQPLERPSDVVDVDLPHVPPLERAQVDAVVTPQSEVVKPFEDALDRSHAGDLKSLYQVCLFLLPNLVTRDVWKNVFDIDDPDRFLIEHLSKYNQTLENAKQLAIDGIDVHGKRLFLLPCELEKTEGRVQKLFQCIQEAAKNNVSEACAFLRGIATPPPYLERQVFFEHLSSLLANKLFDQECKCTFVKTLEQINKSTLTNEKVKELLSIYLRYLGLESAQQSFIEIVQKDLMYKTFSLPAFCFWYSGMVVVPVVSVIVACWLYFVYCEPKLESDGNIQPHHASFSRTITASAPIEKTINDFSCKDRVDRDFHFLTIAAGYAAAFPVLYSAYRAYKQALVDEYAAKREAELLSTALAVLDEKYNSDVWNWQLKLQKPYYFLTCWENMKRKYSIK